MGWTLAEHEAAGEKHTQDLQFRYCFIISANYPSSSCPEMIGLHCVGLHECVCACILTWTLIRMHVRVVFKTSWCQGLAHRLIKLTTGNKCFLFACHLSHLARKCHHTHALTHAQTNTNTCTHRAGKCWSNRANYGFRTWNRKGEEGNHVKEETKIINAQMRQTRAESYKNQEKRQKAVVRNRGKSAERD